MIARRRSPHRCADGGETLLETLIALAITGIVMVGLVSGLTTVIIASDTHRHLSDVEVVARQYTEALVNQADHPPTAQVVSISGKTLTVKNVSGAFPAAPFFIAIDAEVLQVDAVSGTTWALDAAPLDTHSANAGITYDVMDDACATPANLTPTYTVPAGAQYIQTPAIVTPLEFFTSTGSAISGGCANYWQTQLPCKAFATPEHLTECNPELLRVTITVSTTAASPHQASTTTRVLIGRGEA